MYNVNSLHKATTAVYQVTRPGHEHCDVTEGVLLDITPLVVDGKKLVTLYDKDLTEGVNLLIGRCSQFIYYRCPMALSSLFHSAANMCSLTLSLYISLPLCWTMN